jgi:hypothetical protein
MKGQNPKSAYLPWSFECEGQYKEKKKRESKFKTKVRVASEWLVKVWTLGQKYTSSACRGLPPSSRPSITIRGVFWPKIVEIIIC